jgi:hypothetical protein
VIRPIELAFAVTGSAKARLRKFLEEIREYSAVPALLWSRSVETGEWRWNVGFYDRRVVEGADFQGVLIEVDDLQFVSPLPHQAENLQGMQLDWQGDQFVVVPAPKH